MSRYCSAMMMPAISSNETPLVSFSEVFFCSSQTISTWKGYASVYTMSTASAAGRIDSDAPIHTLPICEQLPPAVLSTTPWCLASATCAWRYIVLLLFLLPSQAGFTAERVCLSAAVASLTKGVYRRTTCDADFPCAITHASLAGSGPSEAMGLARRLLCKRRDKRNGQVHAIVMPRGDSTYSVRIAGESETPT
jgi:hypothetical protein